MMSSADVPSEAAAAARWIFVATAVAALSAGLALGLSAGLSLGLSAGLATPSRWPSGPPFMLSVLAVRGLCFMNRPFLSRVLVEAFQVLSFIWFMVSPFGT
jgi:hypothetical protein